MAISNICKVKGYIGRGVYAVEVTSAGHLKMTLSDGKVLDLGKVTGEDGKNGRGISSIEKTATYGKQDQYTIYYTAGDPTNFLVTNGKDGINGTNGRGIVSIRKTAGSKESSTYTITYTSGPSDTIIVSNGKDGNPGNDGVGISSVETKKNPSDTTVTIRLTDGQSKAFLVPDGKNGSPGKNGGYYTLNISATGTRAIVAFIPSDPSMPNVPPQSITLPTATVDPEQIKQAVIDYMTQNPVKIGIDDVTGLRAALKNPEVDRLYLCRSDGTAIAYIGASGSDPLHPSIEVLGNHGDEAVLVEGLLVNDPVNERALVNKRYADTKLPKSGFNPGKFLGTDEKGNVVEKEAPSGGGGEYPKSPSFESLSFAKQGKNIVSFRAEQPVQGRPVAIQPATPQGVGVLLQNIAMPTLDDEAANKAYVDKKVQEVPGGSGTDIGLGVQNATVGQIIEVEQVDESGKPIKWKAVDKPSGGGSGGGPANASQLPATVPEQLPPETAQNVQAVLDALAAKPSGGGSTPRMEKVWHYEGDGVSTSVVQEFDDKDGIYVCRICSKDSNPNPPDSEQINAELNIGNWLRPPYLAIGYVDKQIYDYRGTVSVIAIKNHQASVLAWWGTNGMRQRESQLSLLKMSPNYDYCGGKVPAVFSIRLKSVAKPWLIVDVYRVI